MNFVSPLFRRAAFLSGLALAAPAGLCAQATCGDLVVERIWYAAFDSTAIEVLLTNNGGMDFSGPMMDLVDADQDTIADGQMNWFVLPSGTHTHLLHQVQGMPLPTAPFTGEALLTYHDTGGVEVCVLPVNGIELCPPAPCTQLYLGIHQTDPLVFATIDWSVMDEDGITVASGAIALDTADHWQRNDSLCLPPGRYELHVQASVPSPFGQFYCQLYRDPQANPNLTLLIDGDDMGHLPFTYYLHCAEGINSIAEDAPGELRWSLFGNTLQLSHAGGKVIGLVSLFDARATIIEQRQVSTSTASFDLSEQASGLYIISTPGSVAQRFILH